MGESAVKNMTGKDVPARLAESARGVVNRLK